MLFPPSNAEPGAGHKDVAMSKNIIAVEPKEISSLPCGGAAETRRHDYAQVGHPERPQNIDRILISARCHLEVGVVH